MPKHLPPRHRKATTKELGRAVKLGDLRLSVFSRSLVAKDLSVADDPNFGAAPFLTAKELRIGVSLRRLILSHEVVLRDFEIESPQITVIRDASGAWNFSSIGRRASRSAPGSGGVAENSVPETAKGSATPSPGFSLTASPSKMAASNSQPAPARGQAHRVRSRESYRERFCVRFAVSVRLQCGPATPAAPFNVSGHLGPINGADAAATPAEAQITVKRLDPVAAGFIDPKMAFHCSRT